MRSRSPTPFDAVLLLALGCAGRGPDAGSCEPDPVDVGRVTTATRSPDGEGWCCLPGYPTCNCGYFGGFVVDPCDCGRITGRPDSPYGYCDLAPTDWVLGVDSHGCERYSARWPPTACCNCLPDAGPMSSGIDAATVDDAAVHDAAAADAPADDAEIVDEDGH